MTTVINSFGNLYVTLLLPNGEYVASYSTFAFNPNEFLQKSWFSDVEQVSGYNVKWIGAEPNYSQATNQPYLLAAAKPLRTNGLTYGYVIVGLELSALQQLFNQYKNNESMVIIDDQGRILVDKDSSTIGIISLL